MAGHVRAEFDFAAMSGSGELNLHEGEILTIIREGIEGGWIEAKNAKGKIGLIPETYVTRINQTNIGPPAAPPPPLPPTSSIPHQTTPAYYSVPPSGIENKSIHSTSTPALGKPSVPITKPTAPTLDAWDSWGDSSGTFIAPSYRPPTDGGNLKKAESTVSSSTTGIHQPTYPKLESAGTDEWSDDDWSDDDEEVAEFTAHGIGVAGRMSANRSRSTGPDSTTGSVGTIGRGGTARMKNINRFSNFVKTGMESYILAISKLSVQPGERHEITINGNNIQWNSQAPSYTCTVEKPKKESKLKGLKSFIAYSLVSSLSGIHVARRYKHFDWLHEQLTNKYLLIPIPPLPEKQVSGRYEEDLIEHRRAILKIWVDKLCAHPVLSQSEVWNHFLNCTDEKRWKIGKRNAEKDEYVGGNFFNCISAPQQPLDSAKMERQIDSYLKHTRSLEESYRNMYERVGELQKRFIGPYKASFQKFATSFTALGQSMELDQLHPNTTVSNAIKTSAHVLHKIGNQHEEHAKKEIEHLLDYLYVDRGLVANFPELINTHKSAISKLRENERLQNEGKISINDADSIRQRVDVTTYAMMAEISHQSQERDKDMQKMFSEFFSQQAAFYSSIAKQMTELADLFNAK